MRPGSRASIAVAPKISAALSLAKPTRLSISIATASRASLMTRAASSGASTPSLAGGRTAAPTCTTRAYAEPGLTPIPWTTMPPWTTPSMAELLLCVEVALEKRDKGVQHVAGILGLTTELHRVAMLRA